MPNAFDAVVIRDADGAVPALSVVNVPTVNKGVPAVNVYQNDSTGAAIQVRSQGTLLDLQDTTGVSKFRVASDGTLTAAAGPVWTQLGSTGASGYVLVNGTGTIFSWTVPNDGALHRVFIVGEKIITSNETGGAITTSFTDPAGNARTGVSWAGGAAGGMATGSSSLGWTVKANTTVTFAQNTALTAGAATLFAEMWGA